MGLNIGAILEKQYYAEIDTTSKTELINSLINDMELLVDGRQLNQLNKVLEKVLSEYDIVDNTSNIELNEEFNITEFNDDLLSEFNKTKKLEGCSKNTLKLYNSEVKNLIKYLDKNIVKITTDDIKDYLLYKKEVCGVSNITLDNTRRCLNSFFQFLALENYIKKNPCLKIKRIKTPKKLKKPFSREDVVLLRMAVDNILDKVIFELLLSSGIRVAECASINKSDVDFNENSIYIIGKGDKERKVYFSEECRVSLNLYLKTRDDNNPALLLSPYHKKRISKGYISSRIRELGKKAGVENVHPHRFRRTFATELIHRNVPIEYCQRLLGHSSVETTTIYAITDDSTVKWNHNKFID